MHSNLSGDSRMSACLFMRNYKNFTREQLEEERKILVSFIRDNQPDRNNRFDCDRWLGEAQNLQRVVSALESMDMPGEIIHRKAWLAREGVHEDPGDAYCAGIGRGYFLALMETRK